MIVLSEASDNLMPSASVRDILAATEAARLVGCSVYHIPQDFERCETAENALFHVPMQSKTTSAVWIGYIPTPERYQAIYEAAQAKRIRLVNTLEEHLRAQEFDHAYPFLVGLTPQSTILESVADSEYAIKTLGFPVFVRGAVQSRKSRGWRACVANTLDELQERITQILALENRSRGRVIVRKLVKLRHTRTSAAGFPLGREYRVFLYGTQVLGYGYYWEGDDPDKELTPTEQEEVLSLAKTAAKRLETPYLAVDVGQCEEGDWIVIETGDAQFSGVSQIPPLSLWHQIQSIG